MTTPSGFDVTTHSLMNYVPQYSHIDIFPHKPLISVVMYTYNPKQEWLIEAIESVRKQIYPFWGVVHSR